ncbi:MAG: TIM barrel protein [Marinilabiliaceae bacterium]|jgi:hydroxypyruvate isomerase|nr:TIM barrel protein [Marinilabiliaceae bacterium]
MNTSRRSFLKKAAGAGAMLAAGPAVMAAAKNTGRQIYGNEPFKLKYAPGLGMFPEHAGKDPIDNIKFCNDMGFRAVFDNSLMSKPPELQEKIAKELADRKMDLGPFVLYADFSVTSFVLNTPEVRDMIKKKMQEGVECAKRTGVKWALVVPGRYDERLHRDYQTANVVDNLRLCADIVEKEGLTIVLEPLNTLSSHPGLFLTGIPQTYQICRAVNRKSVKIVDDIFHQQITEGNLIPNIDMAWDEIAAFHLGDNPGRKEPTTGEINFKNIFKHLHSKGYDGVLCMEHGRKFPGEEGEKRVIQAYRECDDF